MRNLKLTIEYDGQDFCGWQRQPNVRTVQGEIEGALQQILQHPVKLIGSGRTDVGVHALGQIANVKTAEDIAIQKLQKGLNGILPSEIRITEICEVPEEFNARFNAIARQYLYRISKIDRAIGRQYVWCYLSQLNVDNMRKATKPFIGKHDFRAFCKVDNSQDNYMCCVENIHWHDENEEINFVIKANRFLHKMVRSIVGTAVEVGRGRYAPEEMERILLKGDRNKTGPTAPAHGLCLVKVFYK